MLNLFAEVVETDFGLREIEEALKELKRSEVLVGIPDDDVNRPVNKGEPIQKNPVTNAELLYIHTHGSPINHIPARPVLEPSIAHNKEQLAVELRGAALAALGGNMGGITPALNSAGMLGQNVARDWFTNPANGWELNSPAVTVDKAKKGGDPRPLIDTGSMRKAITYRVKKR